MRIELNCSLNCSGNGLVIGASSITIDCGGHAIGGTGSGSGIDINKKSNVIVKNCTIKNFYYGVNIYTCSCSCCLVLSGNTLENNKIFNNTGYGVYSYKASLTLNSNAVCNNFVYDFYSNDWKSSIGVNNTCDTGNWNDAGKTKCTYFCPPCRDEDNDGYGICPACNTTHGCKYNGNDCNDDNASINPGENESYYNGIDEDCDTSNDCDRDGDRFNATFNASGERCNGNDCDDLNSSINPEVAEIYNQIDDNCNGLIDEGCCNTNNNCSNYQFCNSSTHLCQDLNCSTDHAPANHRCYHKCDLNSDGIIILDHNDLIFAYKCFLGIEKNCNNYYGNWTLIRQEYNCFIGNG